MMSSVTSASPILASKMNKGTPKQQSSTSISRATTSRKSPVLLLASTLVVMVALGATTQVLSKGVLNKTASS